MPRPPGWKVRENAPLLPGGGWALLELTDALCVLTSGDILASTADNSIKIFVQRENI